MRVRRLGRGLAAAALVALGIGVPIREATAAGTIVVTTTADINGVCPSATQCSLRTALIQGQALSMDVSVPSGTYNLTIPDENSNVGDATKGDLDVTGTVVVLGAGSGSTVIDGGGVNRIFDIATSGNLTVSGVSLRNGFGTTGVAGHQHGANIHNHGSLTLVSAAIIGGQAGTGWGGGGLTHASSATLTSVSNVTFAGNRGTTGGAIEAFGASAGDLQLNHVTAVDNQASLTGGAVHTGNNTSRVKIANSLFAQNGPANCDGAFTNLNGNLSTDGSCAGFLQVPAVGLLAGPAAGDVFPLAPNSLAIDAASDVGGSDQQGNPAADGNGDGSIVRDVGASEAPQNTQPATNLVIRDRLPVRGNPVPPAGGSVRLFAYVTNKSATAATVSRVVFTLPAGVTFDRALTSYPCAVSGPTVLCDVGTVSPGLLPVLVEISVSVAGFPSGTFLVAGAKVSSANPDAAPADNVATGRIVVL